MSEPAEMNALTRIRVVSAKVDVLHHRLEHPLVLSSGTITELPEITVRVEVSDGRVTAVGVGAVNLSDAWAWPAPGLSSAVKQTSMIDYAHQLAASLSMRVGPPAHPLELGLRLHDTILAEEEHPAPALARTTCGSAFDAALHDACGQLTNRSAFAFYDEPAKIPAVDDCFPDGAVTAIRDMLQPSSARLRGWWLIAPGDDLAQTGEQVARHGMTQFKLKLPGSDPVGDAREAARIHDVARGWTEHPVLSVDTNEGSASPEAVLEFLDHLEAISPEAFDALAYLEQPTPRDSLAVHSWDEVGRRVPVLVDEALTSMDDLRTARDMGWSGFAIKTCKGHSFALAAAAWAQQHELPISVQDLTNIGRSAIHSYLLAAHLPTINGIELNSPQYLPGANAPWLPRLAGLFSPIGGEHTLDPAEVVGLGSSL
ncbi:MAG: enolase C-terminal domain-like protein [Brachybacterium sp.]|uniref:enolase C-terminal domain-like protein n=1 Tax=Brachybacterium sp. AOP42-E1-35 TaxID=3457664 RepID=UPI003FB7136A